MPANVYAGAAVFTYNRAGTGGADAPLVIQLLESGNGIGVNLLLAGSIRPIDLEAGQRKQVPKPRAGGAALQISSSDGYLVGRGVSKGDVDPFTGSLIGVVPICDFPVELGARDGLNGFKGVGLARANIGRAQ